MVPPLPRRGAGEGGERSEPGEGSEAASIRRTSIIAFLQALPLAAVFLLLLTLPIALVVRMMLDAVIQRWRTDAVDLVMAAGAVV